MSQDQLAQVEQFPNAHLAERPEQTLARIREGRELVVKIQKELMKAGVHFGVLPGSDKPMLLKDGADLLNQAFQLEAREEGVLDLGGADERKYQVTVGIYNGMGRRLGFGVGVCSTSEDKYKWRKAFKNEYDAVAADRRRTKVYRNPDGENTVYQIRTEPADLENTVLQMATKRAHVQATRQVHAVSDVFADIGMEDLPEEQRDQLLLGGRKVKKPQPKKAAPPTAVKTPPSNGAGKEAPAAAATTTPAAAAPEREPGGDDGDGEGLIPAEAWAPIKEVLHGGSTISLAQSKRLFAIARGAGWGGEDLDREIRAGLGVSRDDEGKYLIPNGRPYELTCELFSKAP